MFKAPLEEVNILIVPNMRGRGQPAYLVIRRKNKKKSCSLFVYVCNVALSLYCDKDLLSMDNPGNSYSSYCTVKSAHTLSKGPSFHQATHLKYNIHSRDLFISFLFTSITTFATSKIGLMR
jgi:hypothetical protein